MHLVEGCYFFLSGQVSKTFEHSFIVRNIYFIIFSLTFSNQRMDVKYMKSFRDVKSLFWRDMCLKFLIKA